LDDAEATSHAVRVAEAGVSAALEEALAAVEDARRNARDAAAAFSVTRVWRSGILYPLVLIRSASICTKSRAPRATHHHHLRSPMSIAPRATRLTTASPKPPHKRNHHQKVDDEAVSLSSLSSSSPESSDCAKNSRITALCIALSLTFRDRSSS
jgi:hypothetical protein